MYTDSPLELLLFAALIGFISILYLIQVIGINSLCGTEGPFHDDLQCKCIGFVKSERSESASNYYCTGINVSNNDISKIMNKADTRNSALSQIEKY